MSHHNQMIPVTSNYRSHLPGKEAETVKKKVFQVLPLPSSYRSRAIYMVFFKKKESDNFIPYLVKSGNWDQ